MSEQRAERAPLADGDPLQRTLDWCRAQWSVLLLSALVLASAIALAYSAHLCRQLVSELQQTRERRDALQVEWSRLLLEESSWGAYARVEREAREALGMRVPSPRERVMISAPAKAKNKER